MFNSLEQWKISDRFINIGSSYSTDLRACIILKGQPTPTTLCQITNEFVCEVSLNRYLGNEVDPILEHIRMLPGTWFLTFGKHTNDGRHHVPIFMNPNYFCFGHTHPDTGNIKIEDKPGKEDFDALREAHAKNPGTTQKSTCVIPAVHQGKKIIWYDYSGLTVELYRTEGHLNWDFYRLFGENRYFSVIHPIFN